MTESVCDKCHKIGMIWNVCKDCDGEMICSRCEEWHAFSSKFSFTKTHAMTPLAMAVDGLKLAARKERYKLKHDIVMESQNRVAEQLSNVKKAEERTIASIRMGIKQMTDHQEDILLREVKQKLWDIYKPLHEKGHELDAIVEGVTTDEEAIETLLSCPDDVSWRNRSDVNHHIASISQGLEDGIYVKIPHLSAFTIKIKTLDLSDVAPRGVVSVEYESNGSISFLSELFDDFQSLKQLFFDSPLWIVLIFLFGVLLAAWLGTKGALLLCFLGGFLSWLDYCNGKLAKRFMIQPLFMYKKRKYIKFPDQTLNEATTRFSLL